MISGLRNDFPESATDFDALKDPGVYEQLLRNQAQQHDAPILAENIFRLKKESTCGPHTGCPAWDGEVCNTLPPVISLGSTSYRSDHSTGVTTISIAKMRLGARITGFLYLTV
jgi:hypothetical protein